ncbi:MAG TPA: cob(I)yrinic acid a,c-diamide adenosyltransferase [Magnetospirillaceae bacterium]|jgi:cob(I)alamin adenosyltransferase
MVRLDRIYTRGGDKGATSLGDGSRVAKHAPRIELMGLVDEANATIGLARLHTKGDDDAMLARIQNDLFDLGADLAVPTTDGKARLRVSQTQIDRLESEIDALNEALAPLTSFILPGGSPASAQLHFARTVVRGAERQLARFLESESLNPMTLAYLNRLSDHMFVMARHLNNDGAADVLWTPGQNR